ncbi:c-type cytochrome [Altererythrobacter lauratis]|uniref:c-type cytochrome n=1 Tax=Alteraurantiacibacter lauratis TaxID=2054627 RepID=UPI003018FA3F
MRHTLSFATASALALALTACGPAEEPAVDESAAVPEAPADVAPVEGEAAAPEAGETPAAEESAAPAASPTPAASASAAAVPSPAATPTAQPTAAPVAMAPPAAFTQCRVCHSVEPGQNGIGPSLAGIHGNRAGQVAGFSYTPGMRSSGLTWNDATLNRYLTDPQGTVPGTTMAIGPLDAAQRAAIIAYLKTI